MKRRCKYAPRPGSRPRSAVPALGRPPFSPAAAALGIGGHRVAGVAHDPALRLQRQAGRGGGAGMVRVGRVSRPQRLPLPGLPSVLCCANLIVLAAELLIGPVVLGVAAGMGSGREEADASAGVQRAPARLPRGPATALPGSLWAHPIRAHTASSRRRLGAGHPPTRCLGAHHLQRASGATASQVLPGGLTHRFWKFFMHQPSLLMSLLWQLRRSKGGARQAAGRSAQQRGGGGQRRARIRMHRGPGAGGVRPPSSLPALTTCSGWACWG